MIDPADVTKYNRTEAELQEFWLFCLVVAGKTAVVQARLLEAFLTSLGGRTPFQSIREALEDDDLLNMLKLSRLGQYTRLARAIEASLAFEGRMHEVTVEELESISGVGSKTARYFVLHSRQGENLAVLDTHVMAYMRGLGLTTHKGTPPKGPKYQALEAEFLKLARASGMTPADFDLMIWRKGSGN